MLVQKALRDEIEEYRDRVQVMEVTLGDHKEEIEAMRAELGRCYAKIRARDRAIGEMVSASHLNDIAQEQLNLRQSKPE